MDVQSATSGQLILVTGPARSGKSEWAETLARKTQKPVIYVATALVDPADREWRSRIEQHQLRRPPDWDTVTEPVNLATVISTSDASVCLLVDSLGSWVANLLEQEEATWNRTLRDLLLSLKQVAADVIVVAEETGWGVVPAYPLGRKFRDRLGLAIRQLSAIAHPVYLVTGGYVLNLSQLGEPLPSGEESERGRVGEGGRGGVGESTQ